jgi:hypothetical protein
MRELNEDEKKAYGFFNNKACNMRKRDKKTESGAITDVDWTVKKRTNGPNASNR